MKILFVSPLTLRFGGGGATWLFEVTRRLKDSGNAIKVVALDYNAGVERLRRQDIDNLYLKGIPYEEIPLQATPLEKIGLLVPSLKGFSRLRRLASDADVVYFMNAHGLDLVFALMGRFGRQVFIAGVHAPLYYGSKIRDFYNNTLARAVFSLLDGHHVLNDFYYDLFKNKMRLKNVFKITNGVNTDKFSPAQDRDLLRNGPFKIVFVGRLNWQKGVDILCRTIKRLVSYDQIQFLVYGSGKYDGLISQTLRECPNLKWFGYLPYDEIPRAYRQAHIVFTPSRQETFCLTNLEALSTGLPSIVSDIEGLRELITQENGRRVALEKEEDFSRAILDLYAIWKDDFARYLRMRDAARRACVENYSWDKIAARIEAMFKEISLDGAHL